MLNWTGEKPIENEWESEAPAELSTHLPSYLRTCRAIYAMVRQEPHPPFKDWKQYRIGNMTFEEIAARKSKPLESTK